MAVKEMEIAEELGAQMKAVSVAEFFKKNKHLLGFDSPVKSMLMVVKEAVDNSLDATEEYGHRALKKTNELVLPEIMIQVQKAEHGLSIFPEGESQAIADLIKTGKTWDVMGYGVKLRASRVEEDTKFYNVEGHEVKITDAGLQKPKVWVDGKIALVEERTKKFIVTITDNGPGIIEQNIPNAFGKLLYGSKFHRLKQSRGQQGIGISSAVLYGQQTTGIPAKITSKIAKDRPAVYMELSIADNNEPIIHEKKKVNDFLLEHGTRVEITIDAEYQAVGDKSIYEFLRRTSIVNPHAEITFIDPFKKKHRFARTSNKLPDEPKEIKPHPHGIEFGVLDSMLKRTKAHNLKGFLVNEFCRVSGAVAESILKRLELTKIKPADMGRQEIEKLLNALHKTSLKRPPTDCLSPIGEENLKKSILRDTKAEFVTTITRKPYVYHGIPFLIEAAIAYGGDLKPEGMAEKLRYANKIPLLYDAAGCAMTTAIQDISWKQYGITNVAQNGTPVGPFVILVHLASVWVPYTSEGKSAIASYDEIIKEMKLAVQECARRLKIYLGAQNRERRQSERRSLFEIYVPELAFALQKLTDEKKEIIEKELKKILGKGKISGEEVEEEQKAEKPAKDAEEGE
jgi:DNA topoisomerase-6 subunit B